MQQSVSCLVLANLLLLNAVFAQETFEPYMQEIFGTDLEFRMQPIPTGYLSNG